MNKILLIVCFLAISAFPHSNPTLESHVLEFYKMSSMSDGKTKIENFKEWLGVLLRERNMTKRSFVDSVVALAKDIVPDQRKWPGEFKKNGEFRSIMIALCLCGNKEAIKAAEDLLYKNDHPVQVILLCSPVDWYPICKHTILSENSSMRYRLYDYFVERFIYGPDSTQETKEKILDLLCLAIGREINPEIVLELDNLLINLCGNAYQFSFERLDFMKSKFFSPEMRNLVREKKYLESREQAGIRIAKELQNHDNLIKFRPLENCSN